MSQIEGVKPGIEFIGVDAPTQFDPLLDNLGIE
jgi:hypothetical protein